MLDGSHRGLIATSLACSKMCYMHTSTVRVLVLLGMLLVPILLALGSQAIAEQPGPPEVSSDPVNLTVPAKQPSPSVTASQSVATDQGVVTGQDDDQDVTQTDDQDISQDDDQGTSQDDEQDTSQGEEDGE